MLPISGATELWHQNSVSVLRCARFQDVVFYCFSFEWNHLKLGWISLSSAAFWSTQWPANHSWQCPAEHSLNISWNCSRLWNLPGFYPAFETSETLSAKLTCREDSVLWETVMRCTVEKAVIFWLLYDLVTREKVFMLFSFHEHRAAQRSTFPSCHPPALHISAM